MRRIRAKCKLNYAQSHRTGFTLIEILVVIAIIALLASILFPVFSRARESARRATCQSNLKQIGLAALQYSQDYDEYYVARYLAGAAGNVQPLTGWAYVIQPYIKSTQVLQCPSDPYFGTTDPAKAKSFSNANDKTSYTDYGFTDEIGSNLNGGISGRDVIPPPKSSTFTAIAVTVMGFEQKTSNAACGDRYGTSASGWVREAILNATTDVNVYAAARRHLEGSNFLFADGHVKWYRPDKITNDDPEAGKPTFKVKP
jgi:prepilin-type N-terminal cleavage/methylation domain-containing protein/prepilin-type processing-associated H-X9-DG protein